MKKEKIYYAHHQWKYNTPIEEHEISIIKSCWPNAVIINPNGLLDETKSEGAIMLRCFELILECDNFVFSTLSGVVGKGLTQELLFAQSAEIPIYKVSDCRVCNPGGITIRMLNSGNNRVYATV